MRTPLVYPLVSDLEPAHEQFGKKAQKNWIKLREKTSNRTDLTSDDHVRCVCNHSTGTGWVRVVRVLIGIMAGAGFHTSAPNAAA